MSNFFVRFREDDEVALAVRRGLEAILSIIGENSSRINEIHPNGYPLLQIAVYNGDMDMVKFLLDKGADVNVANKYKTDSVLDLAVERNFEDIARVLLERGVRVNNRGNHAGNTVLHRAVKARNKSLFELLLDNGADLKATNDMGNSVLELVIREKCIDMLKIIFKNGLQDNFLGLNDLQTKTLIRTAVEVGNKDIVELLLEQGFNFNQTCDNGETALHTATRLGYEEIVMLLLLDHGASVKVIDASGNTMLHCAAMGGRANIFKLMMNYGIDVNAKNIDGQTAMTHAINGAYEDIIRILLADSSAQVVLEETSVANFMTYGGSADIFRLLLSRASNLGREVADAALHAACEKGREEIVKILLKRGARVDSFKAGQTALHLAARNRNESIVRILLDSGADVRARNRYGMTALHEACGKGQYRAVKVLVAFGSEIEAKDKDGKTPMGLAVQHGSKGLVKGSRENNIFDTDNCDYFIIVKLLLQLGAEVCGYFMHRVIMAQSGYAQEFMLDDWFDKLSGPKDVIELFLDYGIDFEEIDTLNECRPLSLAVERKSEVAVQLLLDYGADVNNVEDRIMRYGTTIKCGEILTRHIVKMLNEKLFVSENILRNIDSNKRLRARAFKVKCESEIESMRRDDSAVPFWRILISNHFGLADFARNEEIVRVLKSDECKIKYPIYSSVLKNQLRRGIWRNLLLGKVQYFFKAVGESEGNEHLPKLPKLCVDRVFSYFSNRDFRNLIRVCDPRNDFDLDLCDIELI